MPFKKKGSLKKFQLHGCKPRNLYFLKAISDSSQEQGKETYHSKEGKLKLTEGHNYLKITQSSSNQLPFGQAHFSVDDAKSRN